MLGPIAAAALRASLTAGGVAALSAHTAKMSAADASSSPFKPSVVLTASGAKTAMAAAVNEADKNGWAVTIAVSDAGGTPLLLERRGAAPMTVEIAMGKARTAAISGKETTAFEKVANGDEATRPRLALLSSALLLMEGGVPIIVDGVVVGAIGVSGVRSDQDAQVAKAGVTALLADARAS